MSRCLPFSTEAFANRGSNWEALIKLQKEKDDAKAELRREKKLKKKLKKELKEKSKKEHKDEDNTSQKSRKDGKAKKSDDVKKNDQRHKGKSKLNADYLPERVRYKSEPLEKSDITEEHNQPSCSGSACNFLDSVDSSNKRKRQDDGVDVATESRRTNCCIRLALRKHGEPSVSTVEQRKSCPEKDSETRSQQMTEERNFTAEGKAVECGQVSLEPHLELAKSKSKSKSKKSKSTLFYKTYIEDWVPNPPDCSWLGQNESGDEDWLFGSKSEQLEAEPKRAKASDDDSYSRGCALWPQAIYLSEVDIYALPCTLPF